jgi:hypothetical protein
MAGILWTLAGLTLNRWLKAVASWYKLPDLVEALITIRLGANSNSQREI